MKMFYLDKPVYKVVDRFVIFLTLLESSNFDIRIESYEPNTMIDQTAIGLLFITRKKAAKIHSRGVRHWREKWGN